MCKANTLPQIVTSQRRAIKQESHWYNTNGFQRFIRVNIILQSALRCRSTPLFLLKYSHQKEFQSSHQLFPHRLCLR
jgi:hypothetical protein